MPVRPPSCTSFFILLFGSGAPPPAIAFSCLALSNIFPSPITSATSSFTVAVIRFIDGTTNAGGRWFLLLRRAVAWSCAFKQPMPAGDDYGQAPPLPVWDRERGELLEEWMDDHQPHYESEPQRSVTQWVKSQPFYDRLYALYENSRWSTREIGPFIRKYHIDMAEFEPVRYRSFAEFFDRRFRPGVRKFPSAPDEMGAFAEARYLGWTKVEPDQKFPVKGHSLNAKQILGSADRARPFAGGPVLLVRLAPVDYHHMHYPDEGTTRDHQRLGRRLWTVNWRALQNKRDILFVNERNVNILETRNFGHLGFIEVGALSVGRIAQVHPLDAPFQRGEEKSVFRFGGSAIVVFGEPGLWRPSDDLLKNTKEGVETLVRLGQPVAQSTGDRKQ
jgi:phosphatidylserine decarboxylase